MADVIARLDAELLKVAAAGESKPPPQPVLAVRAAWCASGLLGGWMFGGALAGPAGLGYGALIGAFAGGYKAVTGRHVAELFHGNAALPGGKLSFSTSSAAFPATPMNKSSGCGPGSTPSC